MGVERALPEQMFEHAFDRRGHTGVVEQGPEDVQFGHVPGDAHILGATTGLFKVQEWDLVTGGMPGVLTHGRSSPPWSGRCVRYAFVEKRT